MRALVLVSAVALFVQTRLTEYASDPDASRNGWLLIGLFLLWRVDRHHGRWARGFVVIPAEMGAIIFLLGAFEDPSKLWLSAAFALQALPLLLPPVRDHVQRRPRAAAPVRVSA